MSINTCDCKNCRKERATERAEEPDDCPYMEGTDAEWSWWAGIFSFELQGMKDYSNECTKENQTMQRVRISHQK